MTNRIIMIIITITLQLIAQDTRELRVVGAGELLEGEFVSEDIRDASLKVCGALVILSDIPGLTFSSGNEVVDRRHSPGRDILYLSPDESTVTIGKDGYLPLKIYLYEYGISIESGQVWQITVTGDRDDELIPINIVTNPPGAGITIDGEYKGDKTTQQVLPGAHEITLTKEDFTTITDTITVGKDNTFFSYSLDRIVYVPFEIRTDPRGARIILNDTEMGTTPKGDFKYPGKYNLKLILTGYSIIDTSIELKAKGKNEFEFQLEKNSGFLILSLNVQNAIIKLNNKRYYGPSIELSPDKYLLEITAEGYETYNETITIKKGEREEKNIRLEEITGNLQISVIPLDADMTLMKQGAAVKKWSGLQNFTDIQVGSYTLTAEAEGYKRKSENIVVERDKLKTVRITLEKEETKKDLNLVRGGKKDEGSTWYYWVGGAVVAIGGVIAIVLGGGDDGGGDTPVSPGGGSAASPPGRPGN